MEALASRETHSLANYHKKDIIHNEFQNFVESINNENSNSQKVEILREFSRSVSKYIDPTKFNIPECGGYSRNYLERDKSGWEMLLICWSKDDTTSIHGHPELCSYNYLQGEFNLELFQKVTSTEAKLDKIIKASSGDIYADCGSTNSFCNHIHRITCTTDKGYTLHIYSDDASKGDEFEMI